jgi:hypothetical protein
VEQLKGTGVATHSAPGQPFERPVIEPTKVIQRELTPLEGLSQLFRRDLEAAQPAPDDPPAAEDDTQVMDQIAGPEWLGAEPDSAGRWRGRLFAALALSSAVAVGFVTALLVPMPLGNHSAAPPARSATPAPAAPPRTPPTSSAPDGTDPDGAGVLRQGSSGPAVTELQERLLRIPDVYRDGHVNGSYDDTLAAAVARFQLWYGIRGDETGVYGNDTRRDLESRT